MGGMLCVLFVFHYAKDLELKCCNVSKLRKSLIPSEDEFLFTPYSVFTVRAVSGAPDTTLDPDGTKFLNDCTLMGRKAVVIELNVAPDNAAMREDQPLAQWH